MCITSTSSDKTAIIIAISPLLTLYLDLTFRTVGLDPPLLYVCVVGVWGGWGHASLWLSCDLGLWFLTLNASLAFFLGCVGSLGISQPRNSFLWHNPPILSLPNPNSVIPEQTLAEAVMPTSAAPAGPYEKLADYACSLQAPQWDAGCLPVGLSFLFTRGTSQAHSLLSEW